MQRAARRSQPAPRPAPSTSTAAIILTPSSPGPASKTAGTAAPFHTWGSCTSHAQKVFISAPEPAAEERPSRMPVPGMLTIEDLRRRVDDSQIDTVLLTF